MNPYPWKTVPDFRARTNWLKKATGWKALFIPFMLLTLLCGLISGVFALLVASWLRRRFKVRSGSPWLLVRPYLLAGVVLTIITGGPYMATKKLWSGLHKLGGLDFSLVKNEALWNTSCGVGAGLLAGSLLGWLRASLYNYQSQAYREKPRVTRPMRQRLAKNTQVIATGKGAAEGVCQFGVITDDVLPWRAGRYGMIVERPVRMMMHGCIVGAAGSGKTVLTGNLVYFSQLAGSGVFYMDMKDSAETRAMVQAMAVKAGVRSHVFSMSARDTSAWCDPFRDSTIRPREKASMLFDSLSFPTGGDAEFFTVQAQRWLGFQFDVLDKVGLAEGEGTFDWLVKTSTHAGMFAVLEDYNLRPDRDMQFYQLASESLGKNEKKTDADIGGLRIRLETVVRFAGHLLRPNGVTEPVTFRDCERGETLYFGLSSAADDQTMKTLGSVMLKYIELCSSQRFNGMNHKDTRVLVLTDEAGFLGDRSGALDRLYRQAREANYDVWTASQTLSSYNENTRTEIVANSNTKVVMRVSDEVTATALSNALGTIFVLTGRMEQSTQQTALGERRVENAGSGMNELGEALMLTPSMLTQLEPHHAYVFFTLSAKNNPGRAKVDSVVMENWAPPAPISKLGDDNSQDAPLVKIIPVQRPTDSEVHAALNPLVSESFDEHIAIFNGETPAKAPVMTREVEAEPFPEDLSDMPDFETLIGGEGVTEQGDGVTERGDGGTRPPTREELERFTNRNAGQQQKSGDPGASAATSTPPRGDTNGARTGATAAQAPTAAAPSFGKATKVGGAPRTNVAGASQVAVTRAGDGAAPTRNGGGGSVEAQQVNSAGPAPEHEGLGDSWEAATQPVPVHRQDTVGAYDVADEPPFDPDFDAAPPPDDVDQDMPVRARGSATETAADTAARAATTADAGAGGGDPKPLFTRVPPRPAPRPTVTQDPFAEQDDDDFDPQP